MIYSFRILNSVGKVKYSSSSRSFDDMVIFIDSKRRYARNGWRVEYDTEDDMDYFRCVDSDCFVFYDGDWRN